ncbi:alpha-(1,6)-fucosyltransferase-like [Penaeus japonicus]|uniref:alpha-(1,6)-fucosyltransferase-like n=1 Tax=Penaeus japonicus TaxID=27405 RepID=UPI001C710AF2|nr:alpha-(1,6)-fucosyltransferase-like [Penaeus japonicus]
MLKFTPQSMKCLPRHTLRSRLLYLSAVIALIILILLIRPNFTGFVTDDKVQTRTATRCPELEPSTESEALFRGLRRDNLLMWGYVKARLQLLNQELNNSDQVNDILENLNQYLRIARYKIDQLRDADGRGEWRRREAEDLSELIQHRLRVLQNPKDCDSARKLYCEFSGWNRGIGSQLHHLTLCFVAAYATQRTLILNSDNWYNTSRGLNLFFLPLSDTCTHADLSEMVPWPGTESRLVEFPSNDYPQPVPSFLPRSVPKDISDRLARLHGDPFAWWVGQIFKYALKMNSEFSEFIRKLTLEIGFESPIAGIQVRRTDKLTKGQALIPLKAFMDAVAEYYDDLAMRQEVKTRRVFVATDDPSVIEEAKAKYPDYQFVYMEGSIESAAMKIRKGETNLWYYLADAYFLTRSSYLVCTMTSNLCRLSYEIMQTLHPDGIPLIKILGLPLHHMHREKAHILRAEFSHTPRNPEEMAMEVGDLITTSSIRSNSRKHSDDDGFLTGKNQRGSTGSLFPLYKTSRVLLVEEFPSYEHIDKLKGRDSSKMSD